MKGANKRKGKTKSIANKSRLGKASRGNSKRGNSKRGKPNPGKSPRGKSNPGKSNPGKSNPGKSSSGRPNRYKSSRGNENQAGENQDIAIEEGIEGNQPVEKHAREHPPGLDLNTGIAMVASRVLYMDNHLLIVNKPAGTLTQGDASGDLDLHSLAKAYLKDHFNKPGDVFLGLVHRLDRPVSGVMVFPRTSKAAGRVTRQFKERTIEKRYIAMVEGHLTGSETLVNYVWKDHRRVRIVNADHPKGLRAELTYTSLAIDGKRSLVEVKLGTGRPHQIRVQLANIGHRIVGDFRYRAKTELDGRNLALHSYLLRLEHPTLAEKMVWTALPPETWGSVFTPHIKALIARHVDGAS